MGCFFKGKEVRFLVFHVLFHSCASQPCLQTHLSPEDLTNKASDIAPFIILMLSSSAVSHLQI